MIPIILDVGFQKNRLRRDFLCVFVRETAEFCELQPGIEFPATPELINQFDYQRVPFLFTRGNKKRFK